MAQEQAPPGIDPNVPSVARMYDYYLGGKDNFASDREAAEKVIKLLPNIGEVARDNRDFLIRVITTLVKDGVRQFLDVGAGLPTQRNVHEVAKELAPDSRVVYVDNDPIVLVHARALLATTTGVVAVEGDMREPSAIISNPEVREQIDFDQPVAVLMLGLLHFVPDDEEALRIVHGLIDGLAPGSCLAISHGSIAPLTDKEMSAGQSIYVKTSVPGTKSRTREEVLRFFDGLTLLEPGVVELREWRNDAELPASAPGGAGAVGGVGRIG